MTELRSELQRVDILKSGILEIRENYKNPVDDFLKAQTNADPRALILPLYIETYRILAEARFKGFKRIAIMEDDARFLRDKGKINRLLESVPLEYSCIQLSRMSSHSKAIAANWNRCKGKSINDYFVHGDGCEVWGGAFYILTENGMDQLLNIMAKHARNPDGLFHLIKGLAITKEDLVIQQPMKNSVRGVHWALEDMSTDNDIFGTKREYYGAVSGSPLKSRAYEGNRASPC